MSRILPCRDVGNRSAYSKTPSAGPPACATIGYQQLGWQMNGKRVLVAGLLALAIVVASTSVTWSRPVLPDGSSRGADPRSASGVAGPAGPQQISPVAAYFKRIPYDSFLRSASQTAGVRLPAGRYLVEVVPPRSADAVNCVGVSFPLAPPHGASRTFTGYLTVAHAGDEAEFSCFHTFPAPAVPVSYEFYFVPAG
jgi:hypothetical protein